MADKSVPRPVPLPKAEDYMAADKAARLMRHCTDVLALPSVEQHMQHIRRLAENDKDFRRYFETVLRADPFTDEGDKGRPKAWLMGVGIVLDAIERQDPTHPNHRKDLEIWPVVLLRRPTRQ